MYLLIPESQHPDPWSGKPSRAEEIEPSAWSRHFLKNSRREASSALQSTLTQAEQELQSKIFFSVR